MTTDFPTQSVEALRALVAAGAEIEQRAVDESVLWEGPLGRDTASVERSPDDTHWLVMLRPLRGCGYDDDGTPVFDDNVHIERTLKVSRFDRLGGGNVGMAHATVYEGAPFGTYSVVRPVSAGRRGLVDDWDRYVAAMST